MSHEQNTQISDSSASPQKNWVLTHESFDSLLRWLGPDREQAGRRYEEIRRKLIRIFAYRECFDAEDLADETINRVARKLPDISENYVGDPAYYFYGVAQNIYLEYRRKKARVIEPPPELSGPPDLLSECLEECLGRLTAENRELVLQYYQEEKHAKIDRRRQIADRLGIGLNALRIRAHRIRANLKDCLTLCINRATER